MVYFCFEYLILAEQITNHIDGDEWRKQQRKYKETFEV